MQRRILIWIYQIFNFRGFVKNICRKIKLREWNPLRIASPIEELKQQDYKGKRIYIEVSDDEGNILTSKMDIGVHKDLDIEQEEYCFDVCFDEDSASILINSKAQMITEKLKSMLRFGTPCTYHSEDMTVQP